MEQLIPAPLQEDLARDCAASFHYINGLVQIKPPQGTNNPFPPPVSGQKELEANIWSYTGFEEYFGAGPHYRWAEDGGVAEESMISRVRKIPVGQNPEDVMRDLAGDREVVWKNHVQVMQYLYDTLEKNPDIGGIIGYSEGASIAATFILDEQRRQEETGRERRIKCAMFVTGWPPINPGKGIVLADQDDDLIDVPTLHVVGANGMIDSRT
jgi:hypothetical protein